MRRIKFEIPMAALAAICLLMAPALSMPWENGCSKGHGCGLFLLTDDLTKDKLNNMTPAEIKALEKVEMQKLDNMTLAEIKKLKQQKWQELNNTTNSNVVDQRKVQARGEFQKGCEFRAPAQGWSDQRLAGPRGRGAMAGEPLLVLIMDDVTAEKLNNMTLAQIEDLKQQKLQKLDNMTLGEIKELAQKKAQERNNTILAELKKQNRDLHEIVGLLMGAGSEQGYDAGHGRPMSCNNGPGCLGPNMKEPNVRSSKP